jgi:hypothetical protein
LRSMFRFFLLIFSTISYSFAQEISKECFNKNGTSDEESNSEYCVIGKKVLRIEGIGKTDTVETYIDTVKAYYSGINKIKFVKLYNSQGFQDGNFVEFFPSGKMKERGSYKNGRKVGLAMSYYPSGKSKSILQFFPEEHTISHWPETDFKILDYWDSTGNQIVTKGNGMCHCTLVSGRREVGKVADGLRDSLWSEYSGETLILMEDYFNGKMIDGVRYYKGKPFKYKKFESLPEYMEGTEAMMSVILSDNRYGGVVNVSGMYKTVYISFKVMEDGSVGETKVLKGLSRNYNNEAIRLVKLLEKWYPGTVRGRPVNAWVQLPISFVY